MIGRLLRSVDFERVLRTRTQFSSAHFAVHHVAERPSLPLRRVASTQTEASGADLSTGTAPISDRAVDDLADVVHIDSLPRLPDRVWFGMVVPKRHARRSVTRTLLKRQIRTVVSGRQAALPHGLWVVRLRAPFDRTKFPSAASDALKVLARAELEQLFASAAQRFGRT